MTRIESQLINQQSFVIKAYMDSAQLELILNDTRVMEVYQILEAMIEPKDAVSYFNCLVEDGFDSTDSLGEVVAEDLYFMKKQHQRALLRSIRELTEHNNAQADDQIIPSETLADTIDRTKAQLEEIEAWIDEQNQLVEESLASRLAKEESAKNELD